MKIQNIIFDLDGTLLDSMPAWMGTGKEYLEKYGYPVPDDLQKRVQTMTLYQTVDYFRKELGVAESSEHIVSEIISYVAEKYRSSIPTKGHVLEFLQAQKKKGIRMSILTASESDYARPAIERLGISPYMDRFVTCTELGCFKGDGTPYLEVMRQMDGTVENTLVIEDALYAIRGAKKAGFLVYAIADAITEPKEAPVRAEADLYFYDFQELLDQNLPQ